MSYGQEILVFAAAGTSANSNPACYCRQLAVVSRSRFLHSESIAFTCACGLSIHKWGRFRFDPRYSVPQSGLHRQDEASRQEILADTSVAENKNGPKRRSFCSELTNYADALDRTLRFC
jgi:hypothetical protein